MKYNNMSNEEIKIRMDELSKILDNSLHEDWDKAYNEYFSLKEILDERYREENQMAFDAFYTKHIEGKKWEEIDADDWDFYSDWHKDMFGYRPRAI